MLANDLKLIDLTLTWLPLIAIATIAQVFVFSMVDAQVHCETFSQDNPHYENSTTFSLAGDFVTLHVPGVTDWISLKLLRDCYMRDNLVIVRFPDVNLNIPASAFPSTKAHASFLNRIVDALPQEKAALARKSLKL